MVSMAKEITVAMWPDVFQEGFTLPEFRDDVPLLPDRVGAVQKAVSRHVLSSQKVRAFLTGLPKGPASICPASPVKELQRYVATQRGVVDKSDPYVNLAFCMELVKPVLDFKRQQVQLALEGYSGEVLSDERALLEATFLLADPVDRLWAAWFSKMAPMCQKMDDDELEAFKAQFKGSLSQWDYTVFRIEGDEIVDRRTWAEAFPEEIDKISALLTELHLRLSDSILRSYVETLRLAYECTDIARLEERWAAVDRVFVKISDQHQVFLVHGCESGYEHPFCVSPELRLVCRTAVDQDVVETYRADAIAYAPQVGLQLEAVEALSAKLANMDTGIFQGVVDAGVCLNFSFAGQVLPNRQDIMLEHGGKIFVDLPTGQLVAKLYREDVNLHCTPGAAGAICRRLLPADFRRYVVGHEFSHPTARTLEIDEALGEARDLLEEAKSTVYGLLFRENAQPTAAVRMRLISFSVARVIRYCKQVVLGNRTIAPYVRESHVLATTLFSSGVISLTEEGLAMDLEQAQGRTWFELLESFLRGVIEAYPAHDISGLQELTARFCDSSEGTDLGRLIAWVNRPSE